MRTGRLSPSWFTEPEMARLTGGHEAHRAARTAVSSRQRNFHRVQGAAIDRASPPRNRSCWLGMTCVIVSPRPDLAIARSG
jgi:hypothetical protein